MKLFFGFAIFIWLLCGLVGSWMKDDLDSDHLVMIAKGPITLVKAMERNPPTFRGYLNS